MEQWCLDGASALLFDTVDEARVALSRYFAESEFRHQLQSSSAALIRRAIDNGEQRAHMRQFLERLRPQPRKSLCNRLRDFSRRHA